MLTGSGADTYNLYSITSASLVPEGQREVRFHEPSSRALTGWQRKVLQPARNARRVCCPSRSHDRHTSLQFLCDRCATVDSLTCPLRHINQWETTHITHWKMTANHFGSLYKVTEWSHSPRIRIGQRFPNYNHQRHYGYHVSDRVWYFER